MARRAGEISAREFAERIEVHYETALRWCFRAICESTAKLHGSVRRDITGHYWVNAAAVEKLLRESEDYL